MLSEWSFLAGLQRTMLVGQEMGPLSIPPLSDFRLIRLAHGSLPVQCTPLPHQAVRAAWHQLRTSQGVWSQILPPGEASQFLFMSLCIVRYQSIQL